MHAFHHIRLFDVKQRDDANAYSEVAVCLASHA